MKRLTKPAKRPAAAPRKKESVKKPTPSTRTGTRKASAPSVSQRTRSSSSAGKKTKLFVQAVQERERSPQPNERAFTLAQKLDVLDRLYKLWVRNQNMRFGQILGNVLSKDQLFFLEDFPLISRLEEHYQRGSLKKTK